MIDRATSVRNTLKAKMEHLIPARTGFAFTVDAGDYIEVVDVEGRQTADFWAFHQNDLNEYLSAPHTRIGLMHMFPAPGEAFFSNHRRPIIRVVEDPVPVHDFLSAACDPWRYEELGHKGWHASCQENLELAMKRAGYGWVTTPQPFNIWTNFHLNPDGTFEIRPPATKAGDYILLRAEMPAIIAISACPQDITLTAGGNPTDVLVRLLVPSPAGGGGRVPFPSPAGGGGPGPPAHASRASVRSERSRRSGGGAR